MKILVAEDEPMMLKALDLCLRSDGHEVLLARDGKEALSLFSEMKPDLVITDIIMPFKSGVELLKEVMELNQNLPVLVLTALEKDEVKEMALGYGALEYMTKPFNPKELKKRINDLLV